LKLYAFREAASAFQARYSLAANASDTELMGGAPALLNYMALSFAKETLASNNASKLERDIALFKKANALYANQFIARKFSPEEEKESHDYISHCIHLAMILCEASEKKMQIKHAPSLQDAKELLIVGLERREKNNADAVRLGDVCVWLGRIHTQLEEREVARKYFHDAVQHYETIFPQSAPQILDANLRLTNLSYEVIDTASLAELSALFFTSSTSNASDSPITPLDASQAAEARP
jgi:hypothetical protein